MGYLRQTENFVPPDNVPIVCDNFYKDLKIAFEKNDIITVVENQ